MFTISGVFIVLWSEICCVSIPGVDAVTFTCSRTICSCAITTLKLLGPRRFHPRCFDFVRCRSLRPYRIRPSPQRSGTAPVAALCTCSSPRNPVHNCAGAIPGSASSPARLPPRAISSTTVTVTCAPTVFCWPSASPSASPCKPPASIDQHRRRSPAATRLAPPSRSVSSSRNLLRTLRIAASIAPAFRHKSYLK